MKDEHIEPGVNVVVSYGAGAATVCCMGKVIQRADNGAWWIDVYAGAEHPLPQMFRAEHILGLASLGMRPNWPGHPEGEPDNEVRFMDLWCSVCLFLPEPDRAQDWADSPLTMINGYLVCDDHTSFAGSNKALVARHRQEESDS